MKEMVGGCCVCSDERGWPENPLVYCDGQNCTVAVHQACYGIVTVPTGPWFCRKCESQERAARVRCELCPSRDGALKKTDNQGWAHVVCALYIPEVRFGNVTTMEPIILQLIPQERYAKTCYICQEIGKPSRANVGACMQCNKSNCKQQFHVTCAQSLGLLCEEAGNYLDNVKYCGYCQHHYSKLKKGGNVKTIPPYKPVTHDTSSDSACSPEKEIDNALNTTASSTSATSIKISTNLNTNASSSSKQRKSTIASKSNSSGINTSTSTTVVSGNVVSNLNTTGNTPVNVALSGTNAMSTSNVAVGAGNPFNSGAGTISISNSKGLPSSSSYKEKDKHSKSFSKTSSSSKDKEKDGSSSSTSSRDSREKSSKSSKNKDSVGASSSASTTGAVLTTSTNLPMNEHSNLPGNVQTTAQNLTSNNSNSASSSNNSNNTKEVTKISTASSTIANAFNSEVHATNNDNSNFGNITIDTAASFGGPSSTATTNFGKSTNNSNSSSSSIAKKRKADSKQSAITDEVNTSFRDIIKDVTVTLTPLQQTDFEKEIEKSTKKQRTELSPPTHQVTTTDSNNSHNANSNSNQSATNANAITAGVNTLATSTTSSTTLTKHSSIYESKGATNLTTNVTSASATSSSSSSTVSTSSLHTTSKITSSSAGSTKDHHHRDDIRHTNAQSANNGNLTAAHQNTANTTNAGGPNAPSLYVSVPLSTANVPGLNLPSNTASAATDHHTTPSQSTRAASQQQQPQLSTGNNVQTISSTSSTPANIGGNNSLHERQSPRTQHHPSPVISEHNSGFNNNNNNNTITMQSPATLGVIHQSGKSPSPNVLNTGGNLTATTTESGNLRISYDKQTTRVSQLQEQESAPVRRSRTPDSGIFSSSSFNLSNASTASSSSSSLNSGNGGFKFTYEPQSGSTQIAPTIDTNLAPNTIKDSPPSSPASEAGSARKRGRKTKDIPIVTTNCIGSNISVANDFKDVKIFQNGGIVPNVTSATSGTSGIIPQPAAHMLGNQLNPNSSDAQKLSDRLHMEIQDHSVYTTEASTPQFVGVPFPARMRNSSSSATTPTASGTPIPSANASLASMFGGNVNGNLAMPQSLEELLERQWEQGSQLLMEQAQHFDIASLLSCLHQLQTENSRLEEHVSKLIARRDHLLAVNARLAIPLNTNTAPSQGK